MATAVTIAPSPILQFFNNSGAPNVGGSILTQVGSINAATYQDSAGNVPLPNPIPLNSRGEVSNAAGISCQLFLAIGSVYTFTMFDVNGNQISQAVYVATYDSVTAATTLAGIGGAALVGFIQSGTGAVIRTVMDKERDFYNAKDFGAKFDGTTDDTAALLAGITAVYLAGGGTLMLPRGTALVTSVVFAWAAKRSVNLQGAGKFATYIQKTGATTTPMFDFSNAAGVLDIESEFSNFSIVGSAKAHHGLRMTNCARFSLRNISISACDTGFENLGSLVFSVYDSDFTSNNIGYRQAKANATYCNLITFLGGLFGFNTTWGADLDNGSSLNFLDIDWEVNGTAANLATGAVKLRSTLDLETGESIIAFSGSWIERNHGTALVCDAAAGLRLTFRDSKWQFNDGALGATFAAINMLSFEGVNSSDSITTAASISRVTSSNLGALTDTGTDRIYEASQINGAVVPWKITVAGLTSSVDNAGVVNASSAGFKTGSAVLMASSVALLDNTGVGLATLANSPTAGNPTKWIRINDNGTLRYIPTWT